MNKRTYSIIWAAALALLCFSLVFFNLPSSKSADTAAAAEAETPKDGAPAIDDGTPVGSAPGERLGDFTLELIGGGEFTLSDDPGKVTIINLWATWCTPCVNELPYFDDLKKERGDDVRVLAIHSDLITDSPEEYLSAFDYGIDFAIDYGGEVIKALGGSTMLPQTIIVGRDGIVTYNQVGSVTPEALEELFNQAFEQN